MFVTKTFIVQSTVLGGQMLLNHEVDDAIAREHAVSISAQEANMTGFGDAEYHQAWFENREGVTVYTVQWKVSHEEVAGFLLTAPDTPVVRI